MRFAFGGVALALTQRVVSNGSAQLLRRRYGSLLVSPLWRCHSFAVSISLRIFLSRRSAALCANPTCGANEVRDHNSEYAGNRKQSLIRWVSRSRFELLVVARR
jgi:hypothetical protein